MNFSGNGETAAWGDYDGDGDLDVLVPNYSCGFLWRNDGNDMFVDVLASTNIYMCNTRTARPEGAAFFDYNFDGYLDTYVRGVLWENSGDGTFTDVTPQVGGLRHLEFDEGFTPVDIDNDGDFDIALFYPYFGTIELYEFDAMSNTYHLRWSAPAPSSLVGPVWVDIDNDGDMDAFV